MEARRRSAWWQDLSRPIQRAVARHRRSLAAITAGLAALSALSTLRPAPPEADTVAMAARDLRGGTRLAAEDVGVVDLPPAAVPDGAYSPSDAPVGRLLAAPVRRGEPLTDAAVVGPGLASALPTGQVLTSIQVASTTALLVQPGDRVDVIAGTGEGAAADVVAGSASVVAVPRAGGDAQTRAVVLAVDETAALSVAQAALVAPLQIVVRPP